MNESDKNALIAYIFQYMALEAAYREDSDSEEMENHCIEARDALMDFIKEL